MRALLNGKPGWRYALIVVVLYVPVVLLIRYGVEVYVRDATFTWDDVISTLVNAVGFAAIYTLLARAMYRNPRPTHQPTSDTEPPDTP
jgi:hypothetical protein